MPVIDTILNPLGKEGMTVVSEKNDDSTITIDMGISISYGGNSINKLYVSGNSWVGFGSATQHLNINNRDTSCNYMFANDEFIKGKKCFRVRFEGNTHYSSWNSNNLVWELICFEDGGMTLIIERNDGGGTSNFDTKGNGTITYPCETGKSYALCPQNPSNEGSDYYISEGQYIFSLIKYLVQDGERIKAYSEIEETFVAIGEAPVTSEMFKQFGNDETYASRVGIVSNVPTLLMWSDFEGIYDNSDPPKMYQTGVPHPRLVRMNRDEIFRDDYILGIKKAIIQSTIYESSTLKFVVSVTSGTVWKSWDMNSWVLIDINNLQEIKERGMTKETLESITEEEWTSLGLSSKNIRFAWYMEQQSVDEKIVVRQIKLEYRTEGV